jgi:hypothetical protein
MPSDIPDPDLLRIAELAAAGELDLARQLALVLGWRPADLAAGARAELARRKPGPKGAA